MGKRVPDAIVETTHPATVLLSEPLVTALREAGCAGWEVYDVALKGKHEEDVRRYFGLMITGRCGAVSYGSHGRIVKRMVASGPDVP